MEKKYFEFPSVDELPYKEAVKFAVADDWNLRQIRAAKRRRMASRHETLKSWRDRIKGCEERKREIYREITELHKQIGYKRTEITREDQRIRALRMQMKAKTPSMRTFDRKIRDRVKTISRMIAGRRRSLMAGIMLKDYGM